MGDRSADKYPINHAMEINFSFNPVFLCLILKYSHIKKEALHTKASYDKYFIGNSPYYTRSTDVNTASHYSDWLPFSAGHDTANTHKHTHIQVSHDNAYSFVWSSSPANPTLISLL
jgi:hypothetical protein